jgi:hypothetical protein
MYVTPGTQKAKVGGSWFKVSPGKVTMRPYVRNKLRATVFGVWLKWYKTCLQVQAFSLIPSTLRKPRTKNHQFFKLFYKSSLVIYIFQNFSQYYFILSNLEI